MEGESGVTRSTIDELRSWDIEGDKKAGVAILTSCATVNRICQKYNNTDRIRTVIVIPYHLLEDS